MRRSICVAHRLHHFRNDKQHCVMIFAALRLKHFDRCKDGVRGSISKGDYLGYVIMRRHWTSTPRFPTGRELPTSGELKVFRWRIELILKNETRTVPFLREMTFFSNFA